MPLLTEAFLRAVKLPPAATRNKKCAQRTSRLSKDCKALKLPLFRQEAPGESDSALEKSFLGSWAFLTANVAFVGFLTFDVFSDFSHHLSKPLDQGIHSWVISHLSFQTRNVLFDKFLSDVPIALPLVLWLYLELPISLSSLQLDLQAKVTSSSIKLVGTSTAVMGLSLFLKEFFHRPRPHVIDHNFSFPSGHSLAAVMICGMFLFFKLEPYLDQRNLGNRLPKGVSLKQCLTFGWILIASLTVLGRLGADAHWLTDTLAGCAVGAAVVTSLRVIQEFDSDSK